MLDSDDRPALDVYVAAAERYFRELKDVRRLFAKPSVPLENAGYNVARVGFLLHHLDHHRHHTVLDFGAGMCWLTSVMMHTGCQVIALDVSETALTLGAEALCCRSTKADQGTAVLLAEQRAGTADGQTPCGAAICLTGVVSVHRAWVVSPGRAPTIEAWRLDYNTVRPHCALDDRTPEAFARLSTGLGG
jgi:transposase InsO family protein